MTTQLSNVRLFVSDGINVQDVCGYSAEEDDDEPDNTTTTTTLLLLLLLIIIIIIIIIKYDVQSHRRSNASFSTWNLEFKARRLNCEVCGGRSGMPTRFFSPEFLRFSTVSHHSTIAPNLSTALPSQLQIPTTLGLTQSNSRSLSAVTDCLREMQHEHQVHTVPLTASATR